MMRAALLLVLVAACGPKVVVEPSAFEEDDPRAGPPVQRSEFLGWNERVLAPAGPGQRTGTIDRTALLAVLDAGPGQFLRQLEVTGALDGNRFVGWQLIQLLDKASPLTRLDLVPGDILIALNGAPLSRPDQLMTAWNALRASDKLTCDLLRGAQRFQLEFTIDPPAGRVPPDLAAAMATPTEPPRPPAPVPPTAPPAPATKKPAK